MKNRLPDSVFRRHAGVITSATRIAKAPADKEDHQPNGISDDARSDQSISQCAA